MRSGSIVEKGAMATPLAEAACAGVEVTSMAAELAVEHVYVRGKKTGANVRFTGASSSPKVCVVEVVVGGANRKRYVAVWIKRGTENGYPRQRSDSEGEI